MTHPTVELTPIELIMAGHGAVLRYAEARKRGASDAYGAESEAGIEILQQGTMAELAVAKYLNLFWSPGRYGDPDLMLPDGRRIDVKQNKHRKIGDLRVERDHDADVVYILARGTDGRYNLPGWIDGREAKQEKYLKRMRADRPAAFWFPHSELRPLTELR